LHPPSEPVILDRVSGVRLLKRIEH